MSESMAFIGGVAVAGLAALVLLKGAGGSSLQPNYTVTSQLPTTVVAPPAVMPPTATYPGQPYPNPAPVSPNTEERVQMERFRLENEGLKNENNNLKTQVQQLQSQLQQVYNYQVQLNQQQNQNAAQLQQQSENRWWSSPVVWAVGGITLTIGGGIVVAGVLALFSPKDRPTRTVQVIHPYNGPTPPLAPVRRAEFLPPRSEVRRVEAPEYDDTY
ncbi:heterocyst differentiation related protein [Scytonema sp. HK-05]|uniref:heterocyst differentiation related protein n=1 Tax=Scytonema sp. HK-05 TaxID=1137095 RepID=UPI000936D316|nr:heterocyst differentiation related protein [Scytonema sp. HK-05]OKH59213.1 heterocyst differentiation related protein [Scytonema sp. HK-05]BAY45401.1 heterocyst differentiation related protein [Scytonema sp. HK-05]